MRNIALAIMIVSLAQCSLFFPTQVGFQNNTSTYTFLAIKLGSVDVETALTPGQQTQYFSIDPGTYSLYTKSIDGILYQWPAAQPIAGGFSYTIMFSQNSTTNSIGYSTYVSVQK
ncbi:MAG: hypothetical protein ABSG38_04025 [Spirochaetia bacterium]|jgi:hypothetical protein